MREREIINRLRRIATAPEARGSSMTSRFSTDSSSPMTVSPRGAFPSHRSPGQRRLEARRGEPVRPRGQRRDPGGRAAVADPFRRWSIGKGEFLTGVEAACESYRLPLIGGDTIALPEGAAAVLGLTAIGRAGAQVPDRAGGKAGDALVVGRHAGRCRGRIRAASQRPARERNRWSTSTAARFRNSARAGCSPRTRMR